MTKRNLSTKRNGQVQVYKCSLGNDHV